MNIIMLDTIIIVLLLISTFYILNHDISRYHDEGFQ